MLKELKKILKPQDERELESAESEFDDLMLKLDKEQEDISKFERHLREQKK